MFPSSQQAKFRHPAYLSQTKTPRGGKSSLMGLVGGAHQDIARTIAALPSKLCEYFRKHDFEVPGASVSGTTNSKAHFLQAA